MDRSTASPRATLAFTVLLLTSGLAGIPFASAQGAAPTVVGVMSAPSPLAAGPIVVMVEMSEAIVDLTNAEVQLVNGSAVFSLALAPGDAPQRLNATGNLSPEFPTGWATVRVANVTGASGPMASDDTSHQLDVVAPMGGGGGDPGMGGGDPGAGGGDPGAGGGAPGSPCDGPGNRTIAGRVFLTGFDGGAVPGNAVKLRLESEGCMRASTPPGDPASGYNFSFSSIRENSSWIFTAYYDANNDNANGSDEPATVVLVGAAAGNLSLGDVELHCNVGQSCPQGGGSPPPPGDGGNETGGSPPPMGGGGGMCNRDGGAWINGTVYDSNGNAVAGAWVQFENRDTQSGEGANQTDGSGAFSCRVPGGTYTIRADAPGLGQAYHEAAFANGSASMITLNLSFNARPPYHAPTEFYGGTVHGNVTVGGAPTAGVRVNLFPGNGVAPCQETFGGERTLRCNGDGQTDENGAFVITGLNAGTFNLYVDGSEAHLPSRFLENHVTLEGVSADAATNVDIGVLVFSSPALVRGWVNTSDGAGGFTPVANVRVSAFPTCLDQMGPSPGGGASCGSYGDDLTNATGYYEIYVTAGNYSLQAQTDSFFYTGDPLSSARVDCYPGALTCVTLGDGGSATSNFTLSAGLVVRGRVLDGEGLPVRAFINIQESMGEGPRPCCAPPKFFFGQTAWDNSGNFSVTVDPGTYDVRIEPDRWENPDLSSKTLSAREVTGTSLDLGDIVLGAGSVIRGNVTAGGDPVPFVNVIAFTHVTRFPGQPCCPGSFAGFGFTDADGAYTLSGLPEGQYDIMVEPGWGAAYQRKAEENVSATSGNTTWTDIALSEGGVLAGFVLDSSGQPVAFANVDAFWQPDFTPHAGGGPGMDDGPDGGGAAGGDGPGEHTLSGTLTYAGSQTGTLLVALITDDDMVPPRMATITGTAASATWEIAEVPTGTWRLAALLDINANTQPDADEPLGFLAGASLPSMATILNVTASQSNLDLTLQDAPEGGWPSDTMGGGHGPSEGGGMGPGPGGPGMGQMCETGCWGHATTDGTGYYAIRGLSNGTFGMFVRPPSDSSLSSANLDAFRDTLPTVEVGVTTYQNFTLGSAGTITGCVQDAEGAAVRFAWVNAFSPASGFGGGEPTGADGCFQLRGVRAGLYEVAIDPPFGSSHTRKQISNVQVNESETTALGTITLAQGITFSGFVLDANGDPVAFAYVNAFQIHDGPTSGPGAWGFAQTDGDGAFTIRGLTAGRYGVQVQPPFGSPLSSKFIPELRINESGRSGYEIRLGGGGWINGTILLPGGAPAANLWVGAFSFTSHSGSGTMTDANGRFNLTGLEDASDYNLDVFPPPGRFDLAGYHEYPLAVVAGQGTLPGPSGNGTITLGTGGTLRGHVHDADGDAVSGAFVNVGGRGTFGWGMTDDNGDFEVPGLSPATGESLRVFVQPGPGSTLAPTQTTATWSPDADGVTDMGNVTMSSGKTLSGRVTRGGVGVADAQVFAWPTLDADGRFTGPPSGGAATTDANGWYNLTGVLGGQHYDVSVQPTDGSAGSFTRDAVTMSTDADSTWHNVTLENGGGIVAHVRIAGTSDPVVGANVDCFSPALHAGRSNTTNASGDAAFEGLAAGSYDCRAFAPGYEPNAATATVTSSATTEVTIELNGGVTYTSIAGTYSTGNASSADGLLVVFIPNGTVDATETTGFNVTDDEDGDGTGSYALSLPPGAYDVRVLSSDGTLLAKRDAAEVSGASATIPLLTYGEGL